MSVQTEVTRLSNAKAAIASAITAKGVTVPSTTKIDGMASLIESIPTGGLPAVITPGDTPVVVANPGLVVNSSTTKKKLGAKITIPKDGTYRIKFWAAMLRSTGSSDGIWLYKNGAEVSGSRMAGYAVGAYSADMALVAGDELELWGKGSTQRQSSNTGLEYVTVTMHAVGGGLMACANV